MPMKLLTDEGFRAAAKAGETPEGTLFKFATTESEQVGDEAARTQRFVFSDATVDHSNDSIDPKGWDLGIFNRNPVALFAHMSWDPPIGRASNVGVQAGKLVGDIEFAAADVYDFADTIYRLVKGKFLNAVSVGFLPKEWVFSSDKDRPYGIDFKKQLLLEISLCPVPCNPNALGEARAAGVDTRPLVDWAEKVLDSGDTVFLPRTDLEILRVQAKGAEPTRYYLQTERQLGGAEADRVADAVKRWRADPDTLLILPPGIELRSLGETKAADWTCGAARDLPLDEDGGAWDGAAAEASIFEHAGGDDFDPAIARKGFLAYDASAPKLRGSYKLPFAHLHGDVLKADAGGIRAAASRLPDTDIPDSVKESARAVIDHYEAQMKTTAPVQTKAGRRISAATQAKLDDLAACHGAYHDAMTKCIAAVMGDAGEEPDGDPDDSPELIDPAAVVDPDDDKHLSPEARRLKEARALKASLPTND